MTHGAPRPVHRCFATIAALLAACPMAGCSGVQSSLAPAGREADRLAALFWWMTAGALTVWVAVIALAWYCLRREGRGNVRRFSRLLIVGGGAIVPTIVLTILLVYGLSMLPQLVARAPDGFGPCRRDVHHRDRGSNGGRDRLQAYRR